MSQRASDRKLQVTKDSYKRGGAGESGGSGSFPLALQGPKHARHVTKAGEKRAAAVVYNPSLTRLFKVKNNVPVS